MNLSDSELIIQFNNGRSAAFEELVYRYDRQVLSIALKYLKDEDDAKDVYQEVFLRVYRGLKNFQFKSEFSTWLFRVATNVCLTHKSRIAKRDYVSLNEGYDEETGKKNLFEGAGKDESPDKIIEGREIKEQLDDAVNLLSPKQRMCFVLKHYEGYKIREIAEIMKCTEGTIKKYLFESMNKVKAQLIGVYK